MTTQETIDKLVAMRQHGFVHALREQLGDADKYHELGFEDRLGLLVDREWAEREARSLTRRLQIARLRDKAACIEDIDYQHPRGLDRALMRRLATCEWITKQLGCLITGKTGCGKTYIACALGNTACRRGHSVIYRRIPRLMAELEISRGDGSYPRLLARLARADLLILDDWGLAPLGDQARRDLVEVIDDRHGERSTVVASQLPVGDWHAFIGEPTIAESILDRLVHNAYRLELKGPSIRKKRSALTKPETSDK